MIRDFEKKPSIVVQFGFANSQYKESLTIYKSEVRALTPGYAHVPESLKSQGSDNDFNTLVVSTTSHLGTKQLELRSILQVVT